MSQPDLHSWSEQDEPLRLQELTINKNDPDPIWDNASWHVSKQVRAWLREHNQTVLHKAQMGKAGVRIIPCWLPTKSPWLNRIEPKWVHGKRAIVEPARMLTAKELRQRVCDYFGCEQMEPLTQSS